MERERGGGGDMARLTRGNSGEKMSFNMKLVGKSSNWGRKKRKKKRRRRNTTKSRGG